MRKSNKSQSLSINKTINESNSRSNHSNSSKKFKKTFKPFCPAYLSQYSPEILQKNEDQRKFMVKFACLTVIFQKICLIAHLFFLISDKNRHNYKEIEDKYE